MIILTKKQIKITVVSIIILILAIAITVFALNIIDKDNNSNSSTDINQSPINQADNLKVKANAAAKNNQFDKAKTLYEEVRKIYQDTNDTDGVAEIDTALYLIDNPSIAPTPAEIKNTDGDSELITIN